MYFGSIRWPAGLTPLRIVRTKSASDQRDKGPLAVRSGPPGAPGSGPWPPVKCGPWQKVQPPSVTRYAPGSAGGGGTWRAKIDARSPDDVAEHAQIDQQASSKVDFDRRALVVDRRQASEVGDDRAEVGVRYPVEIVRRHEDDAASVRDARRSGCCGPSPQWSKSGRRRRGLRSGWRCSPARGSYPRRRVCRRGSRHDRSCKPLPLRPDACRGRSIRRP